MGKEKTKAENLNDKQILGMPPVCFWVIFGILILGIIIGSFCDFDISESISNETSIGDWFYHYSNIFSGLIYPIGGICIFTGLKNKGEKFHKLAYFCLFIAEFYSVHYLNDASGKYVRKDLGYKAEEGSSVMLVFLAYLILTALVAAVSFVTYILLDRTKTDTLLAIGLVIIISGIISMSVNDWLKYFACRPRYRYLITLDDPISEFKNWWEMSPYLVDESNFKSWPSGHMTRSVMMLTLPMIVDGLKCRKRAVKYVLFSVAVLFIILLGYNRIHTNAHFLTDVCFGSLFALSIYGLTYKFVFSSVKH